MKPKNFSVATPFCSSATPFYGCWLAPLMGLVCLVIDMQRVYVVSTKRRFETANKNWLTSGGFFFFRADLLWEEVLSWSKSACSLKCFLSLYAENIQQLRVYYTIEICNDKPLRVVATQIFSEQIRQMLRFTRQHPQIPHRKFLVAMLIWTVPKN